MHIAVCHMKSTLFISYPIFILMKSKRGKLWQWKIEVINITVCGFYSVIGAQCDVICNKIHKWSKGKLKLYNTFYSVLFMFDQ